MAEFERAVYRVYERCLEGMRDDDGSTPGASAKSCRAFEVLCLTFGSVFLVALVLLHVTFVGQPGCLPAVLAARAHALNLSSSALQRDQVLQITVDQRYAPTDGVAGMDSEEEGDTATDDAALADAGRRQRWRRQLRSMFSTKEDHRPDAAGPGDDGRGERMVGGRGRRRGGGAGFFTAASATVRTVLGASRQRPFSTTTTTAATTAAAVVAPSNTTDAANATALLPPKAYHRPKYDFVFAYDVGVLALPEEMLFTHHFDIVNVTLSGTQCFGGYFIQVHTHGPWPVLP
jgi:hypothetical protein